MTVSNSFLFLISNSYFSYFLNILTSFYHVLNYYCTLQYAFRFFLFIIHCIYLILFIRNMVLVTSLSTEGK